MAKGGRGKEKIVQVESAPQVQKWPKTKSEPQFLGGFLSWRFGSADKGGPFAWSSLPDDRYREVMEKLHSFETMKQDDITKSGSHSIETYNLSKEAKDRLTEIKLDDIDEIMSFRMNGKGRVICHSDGSLMRILWWDPDHLVCPSKKRHT